MKHFYLALIFVFSLFLQPVSGNTGQNWLDGWENRIRIEIDHNKIDASLTHFPVAVMLDAGNFDFTLAEADGSDIRFTTADGSTPLVFEREMHEALTQSAVYWVRIPSVVPDVNTVFYLYYGNTGALDGATTSNVWDNGFKAVWHMGPDEEGDDYIKESVNGIWSYKTQETTPIEVPGNIGIAQEFDGEYDEIVISSSPHLRIENNITISAWLNPVVLSPVATIIGKGRHNYQLEIQESSNQLFFKGYIGSNEIDALAVEGEYNHVVMRYDNNFLSLYVNGARLGHYLLEGALNRTPFTGLSMGTNFKGIIDEVKISNVARSSAWIKADYHSGYGDLLTFDASGFDVDLAEPGNKTAGVAFDLSVSNAKGLNGLDLDGAFYVIVTSDQSGEVHNAAVSFSNGVATVPVTLTFAGLHNLTIDVAGVTEDKGLEVTVDPAMASQLMITQQPTGGSGINNNDPVLIGTLELQTVDAYFNPSTTGLSGSQIVTAAIEHDASALEDAELGGTIEVGIESGTATFINLSLDRDGTGFTLRFTSTSFVDLGYVITGPFDMTGVEDYSGFEVTHPGPQVTEIEFNLAIASSRDIAGNLMTGNIIVTVTSSNTDEGTAGEVFTGEVNFQDGEAAVPLTLVELGMHNLRIEVTGVTLPVLVPDIEVVAENLSGFDVALTEPGGKYQGIPFDLSITQAKDIAGHFLDGEINVTVITNQAEGEVYNQIITFVGGQASITVTLTTIETHELTVAVSGVTDTAILPGVIVQPDQSGFNVALAEPGNKTAGEPFDIEITSAKDIDGNDLSGEINITVTTDQPEGEIFNQPVTFTGGSATANIILTLADFHNLTIDVAGVTEDKGLEVTVDPATVSLRVTGQPAGGSGTNTDNPVGVGTIQLEYVDDWGNPPTSGFSGPQMVAATIEHDASTSEATLGGTLEVDIQSGTAIFDNLTLDRDGTGFTLRFTSTSPVDLGYVVTDPFDMTGVEDYSGFDVTDPGTQYSGVSFSLEIINAQGINGASLTGNINVTINSNNPSVGTLVFDGPVDFLNGTADVNINNLVETGLHELTVVVVGVTDPVQVPVVIASGLWTWTGGNSSESWHDPDNWSPAGVPVADGAIEIPSGSPVISVSDVEVLYLEIQDGGLLTVELGRILTITAGGQLTIEPGGSMTADGTLTNNAGVSGLIVESDEQGTGSLILNNSGVLATVQRWVSGNTLQIVSTPVSGMTIGDFLEGNNKENDIFYHSGNKYYAMTHYDETSGSNGNWAHYYGPGDFANALSPGSSYLIRKRSTGVITFRGELVPGISNLPIPRAGSGWHTLGNPFTSALRIKGTEGFLLKNSTDGLDPDYAVLYIYDPDNSTQYSIITNANSEPATDRPVLNQDYIAPGQGFLVRAKEGGGAVKFTAGMKAHEHAVPFFKKSSSGYWPTVIMNVSTDSKEATTVVTFNENMTTGLDVTYDAGLLGGDPDFKLYTRLVEGDNGINFAIQCLPDRGFEKMEIPLGLDFMSGGEVRFSTDILTLPEGAEAVLEDREMDLFTDLNEQDYVAYLAANTEGTGRFFLHINMQITSSLPVEVNRLEIYSFGSEVFIKGIVKENTNAVIFDIMGRKIKEVRLQPSEMNIINLNGRARGIYLINVHGGDLYQTKRLYIE